MNVTNQHMEKICRKFERIIVSVLMVFMMIAVILSTIHVGITIYQRIISPPFMLLDINEAIDLFGFILMVVIGLELLETIKAYFEKGTVHVEVVILVAVVAVARKIIIMDYTTVSPLMIFAIAFLILALSAGFYVVNRTLDLQSKNAKKDSDT